MIFEINEGQMIAFINEGKNEGQMYYVKECVESKTGNLSDNSLIVYDVAELRSGVSNPVEIKMNILTKKG